MGKHDGNARRWLRPLLTAHDQTNRRRTGGRLQFCQGLSGERLCMAGPADILARLRTVGEQAQTAMIGGHSPGLEELVAQLTGERQDLPTAALARILLPIDQWRDLTRSTRGTLLGHWRPTDLT